MSEGLGEALVELGAGNLLLPLGLNKQGEDRGVSKTQEREVFETIAHFMKQ